MPKGHVTVNQTQLITVKQIGFEGLSEDVDEDGWVAKLPRECVPRTISWCFWNTV